MFNQIRTGEFQTQLFMAAQRANIKSQVGITALALKHLKLFNEVIEDYKEFTYELNKCYNIFTIGFPNLFDTPALTLDTCAVGDIIIVDEKPYIFIELVMTNQFRTIMPSSNSLETVECTNYSHIAKHVR